LQAEACSTSKSHPVERPFYLDARQLQPPFPALPRREIEDSSNMFEIQPRRESSHQPPGSRLGQTGDSRRSGFPPAGRFHQDRTGEAIDIGFAPTFFLSCDIRRVRQYLANVGIPFACQLGQQRVPDAIARESWIAIRRVLAPFDSPRSQMSLDFSAADLEQRTNETLPRHGQDPRQTGDARAAQQAEENGFGLIVESMASGDVIRHALLDQAREESPPDLASYIFEISVLRRRLRFVPIKRETVSRSDLRNEALVFLRRLPAPLMIDMRDSDKRRSEAWRQFPQTFEQADRIRPSGNGSDDATPWSEHGMARNRREHLIEHGLASL
jgi:hypothetical protein